ETAIERALAALSLEREARANLEPLVRELAARGAAKTRHGRRTFLEHLIGTWRILQLWPQPEALCPAGLFHSVYGTEYFRTSHYATTERERVRAVIGEEAEEIAFSFCTIERRAIHEGPFAQLQVLEAANIAEQTCAPSGAPGSWTP